MGDLFILHTLSLTPHMLHVPRNNTYIAITLYGLTLRAFCHTFLITMTTDTYFETEFLHVIWHLNAFQSHKG